MYRTRQSCTLDVPDFPALSVSHLTLKGPIEDHGALNITTEMQFEAISQMTGQRLLETPPRSHNVTPRRLVVDN